MRRLQMNWAPNVWPWQVEPRQAPAICQGRPSGTLTRRPARIHGRGARCVGLPERVASICIHLLRARDGRRSSHRQATTETRSITLREAQDQKQITAQPVAPSRPRARSDACTPHEYAPYLELAGRPPAPIKAAVAFPATSRAMQPHRHGRFVQSTRA